MADLQQNISNTVNIFGQGPTNKWNAHNWGAFLWGEGNTDMIHGIYKFISNDTNFSTEPVKEAGAFIDNALSCDAAVGSIEQIDNARYRYVFVPGSTNAIDRIQYEWTEVTVTNE